MPNLAVQYPTGLEGFFGGMTAGRQLDDATRNNQLNQQSALQEMFLAQQQEGRAQQQLPVDLDYKRALTGQTQETTRGLFRKNAEEERTKEERYRASISKYARELHEDELKSARAQIEAMGLDPNPEAQKFYKTFLPHFKEIEQERMRITQQGEKDEKIARIRAEETRATQAAKPVGAAGAAKPMSMVQYEAMLRQAAAAGDTTAAQALAQLEEDKRRRAAAGALITDQRVRGLLGLEEGAPDTSSTGKVEPKAATKYEKGKQYTGRTGTYEYLGGPEADPKSWKKIK